MENPSSAEDNKGEIDHHGGGRCNDEFREAVQIVSHEEFSQLLQSQPKKFYSGSWRHRQIQRVPPQVRWRRQQSEHVYDPVMVSLGPYHHGRLKLRRAEEFKYFCLDWCCRGDEKRKILFYNKIFEKIEVIRDCYAEVRIVQKYDDKALALMMLLDACIIINFIHNFIYMNRNSYLDWQKCLGAASVPFMFRDMMLQENQIPFEILKLLIGLQYEKEEAEGFVQRYLSHKLCIDLHRARIPRENEEPPIHFLEGYWRVLVKEHNSEPNRRVRNRPVCRFWLPRPSMREKKNEENKFLWSGLSIARRSVMDLKAKGIHIRPYFSSSLMDITFTSHAFYGQLQLPAIYASSLSPVVFSNLIAYEVSPNSNTNLVVLSYAIFMKSLIQSAADVKELQDNGILLNRLANLEKVVELFKEIDTFGLHDQDIFMDVRQRIEEHCSSKAKTWIADLIHRRFRTPWAAIALFAAVFLLCLAFLQTFFTIRPVK